MSEIYNFCYSCLIGGGCERTPMTEDEAAYNMREWEADGVRLPRVTAECLAEIWNEILIEMEG